VKCGASNAAIRLKKSSNALNVEMIGVSIAMTHFLRNGSTSKPASTMWICVPSTARFSAGHTGLVMMSEAFSAAWSLIKEEDPHADIPDENKGGECYMCAANHIYMNPDTHTLVHGDVTGQGPIEGVRYGHAWTEFEGDDKMPMVYDPSVDVTLPAALYYHLGQINQDEIRRYSSEEMNQRLIDTSIWGPWDE